MLGRKPCCTPSAQKEVEIALTGNGQEEVSCRMAVAAFLGRHLPEVQIIRPNFQMAVGSFSI
jgi:hypothetical protein